MNGSSRDHAPTSDIALEIINEKLSGLYGLTGEDWLLTVSHSLTEPSCPTAWVHPESDAGFQYFRSDADTIEGAIASAVDQAHRCLILRQDFTRGFPLAYAPDEEKVRRWLGLAASSAEQVAGDSSRDDQTHPNKRRA